MHKFQGIGKDWSILPPLPSQCFGSVSNNTDNTGACLYSKEIYMSYHEETISKENHETLKEYTSHEIYYKWKKKMKNTKMIFKRFFFNKDDIQTQLHKIWIRQVNNGS